jgi:hypothetical protein
MLGGKSVMDICREIIKYIIVAGLPRKVRDCIENVLNARFNAVRRMDVTRMNLFPVFAFPVILLIGILLIPVNPDYNDHALALQAVEQVGRWFTGHLVSAIAFSFAVWATREILGLLTRAPWYTLIFIATGAGLYSAGMGVDGIAPVAIITSGASALVFFDGSGWWVSGVFMAGTLSFALGLFIIIGNAIQAKLVEGVWRYVIFVSALVFVSAPAIPSGWALYGVGLAALGIFIPLGVSIQRKYTSA